MPPPPPTLHPHHPHMTQSNHPPLPSNRSLKLSWNNDLRRVRLEGEPSLDALRALIVTSFPALPTPPTSVRITYTDPDGDVVSIHTDSEVRLPGSWCVVLWCVVLCYIVLCCACPLPSRTSRLLTKLSWHGYVCL
jgi:hypothetical protein